ncbi:MAG: ATP-binding protein [Candidatus Ancillula sp.]|jgi:hypothetical protein|nr:ATP-binding protein [Candidatus Ancillula sp.]
MTNSINTSDGTIKRRMPLGIQTFSVIRRRENVYVDKTALVYALANDDARFNFLARPRRFGKSLLISTLREYFEGNKDLFAGLEIEKLESEWVKHPVLHFDFNVGQYFEGISALEGRLDTILSGYEKIYGSDNAESAYGTRLEGLIRRAYEQTGQQVVVLIDEYDKPLLGKVEAKTDNIDMLMLLKSFYVVLKSSDAYIRFAILTGVSKFSKVSIFSDLNQLRDISMLPKYAGICGIMQEELEENFKPEIKLLAEYNKQTEEEALEKLRKHYNGYHFSEDLSVSVYNPFSTINTFSSHMYRNYWYETGTPTFLVEELRERQYDFGNFEKLIPLMPDDIDLYRIGQDVPIALLYQTGYLTIKGVDDYGSLLLGFPNEEVKFGFIENLLAEVRYEANLASFNYHLFLYDLDSEDFDSFFTRLQSFYAAIPYDLNNKQEKHYQTIFFLLFTLLGRNIESEVKNSRGRTDLVMKTKRAIFVFEFKLDGNGTADDALQQIEEQGYTEQFKSDPRKVFKIGCVFDNDKRIPGEWKVAEN